jgi:hypothetical protein
MSLLPRIIFDTSGLNKMEDGGPASEPLMKALESGFEVILTAMSADEIIATKKPNRREALLSRFGRLLYSATCIWPPHEIIRALVSAHSTNPNQFDWAKVHVRAREYETAIPRRDFPEVLYAQTREYQLKAPKEFQEMWKKLRPELDAILAKDPSKRPSSYREAVTISVMDGGVLWGIGRGLYRYVSGSELTEAEVRAFMDVCPPFRAACYGLVMAWYNGSLRVQDGTPTAGRNDLMMAVYLPYCSRFVTADEPQRKELREIGTEAQIDCEILSFEEFDLSFAVVAQRRSR